MIFASAAPSLGRPALVPSRPTSTFSATVRLGKSCGSWWTTATARQSSAGDQGRPLKSELAGVGALLAGDHAHERALSGAVRSGDAEHLAGPNVEVETGQRDGRAIALCAGRGCGSRRRAPFMRPALAEIGEREVERDRDDGDEAEEDLLDVRPGREQRQALLQFGEEQRPAHRPDDRALAAAKDWRRR